MSYNVRNNCQLQQKNLPQKLFALFCNCSSSRIAGTVRNEFMAKDGRERQKKLCDISIQQWTNRSSFYSFSHASEEKQIPYQDEVVPGENCGLHERRDEKVLVFYEARRAVFEEGK